MKQGCCIKTLKASIQGQKQTKTSTSGCFTTYLKDIEQRLVLVSKIIRPCVPRGARWMVQRILHLSSGRSGQAYSNGTVINHENKNLKYTLTIFRVVFIIVHD